MANLCASNSFVTVTGRATPVHSCSSLASARVLDPIRCSKRKKKLAGKPKLLPASNKQLSSAPKPLQEHDILLGVGGGASTVTALRPRLEDGEQPCSLAQQVLLRSFHNSLDDPLCRFVYSNNEENTAVDLGKKGGKELQLQSVAFRGDGVRQEEAFDETHGNIDDDNDLEKYDVEGEDEHVEWVEVSAEEDGAETDEEQEQEEVEEKEFVQYWEGSLGPMSKEEETDLLRQAGIELAQLKKERRSNSYSSNGRQPKTGRNTEKEKRQVDSNMASNLTLDITEDENANMSDDEVEDVFIARITKEMKQEAKRCNNAEGASSNLAKRAVPSVMRCFDRAKIYVKAGDGGNGVVAFRREKFVPFGGPSGGSGGRGGNIYIEVDASMNSLLSFRKSVHFRAGRGCHGLGKSQDGAAGLDCTIKVPLGTVAREAGSNDEGAMEVLLELTKPGQQELLLPGGRGGRGNAAFRTGWNNTPQLAENGEKGAEMWLELELKLVADVGIIGVPNAGKSTLLSVISAAQPAIGAYPFTTLLPNLGVVPLGFEATIVFADLPGLLEGAHLGFGLGHEFLRHAERCRVLVHMVDGMSQQPEHEYEAVRLELELFNPALSEKPYIVAFNKMDIPEAAQRWGAFQHYMKKKGIEPLCVSAATKAGTAEVVSRVHSLLQALPSPDCVNDTDENLEIGEMVKQKRSAPIEQFAIDGDVNTRQWEIHGVGLERFTQMTNWEYLESLKRFQHVLNVTGVNRALKERGVSEGDTVTVGQMEFVWHDSEDLGADWKRGSRGSRLWPH